MFCTNCGAQIIDGSAFCTKCGAELQNASALNWQLTGPSKRWASRMVDFVATSFLWGITLLGLGDVGESICDIVFNPESSIFFMLFLPIIFYSVAHFVMDGLFYKIFGNTLGKWLFGISILEKDGNRISPSRYFKRNMMIFLQGWGLGIPIINLVTMTTQYNKLSKEGTTTYDKKMDLLVVKEKQHPLKILLAIIIVVLLVRFYMLHM